MTRWDINHRSKREAFNLERVKEGELQEKEMSQIEKDEYMYRTIQNCTELTAETSRDDALCEVTGRCYKEKGDSFEFQSKRKFMTINCLFSV